MKKTYLACKRGYQGDPKMSEKTRKRCIKCDLGEKKRLKAKLRKLKKHSDPAEEKRARERLQTLTNRLNYLRKKT